MSDKIQSFKCPNCNAPIKIDSYTCSYCGHDYIVSDLSSLEGIDSTTINKYISIYKDQLDDKPNDSMLNLGLGICYLNLGLNDFAQSYLKRAVDISPENSETYFYYAFSLINEEKLNLMKIQKIKEIEKLISAAIKINPKKAIYYYFLIIIKKEFYIKNGFRNDTPINELIEKANSLKYDEKEIKQFIKLLNITDNDFRNLIKN